MLDIVVFEDHVRVPTNTNVDPVIVQDVPIAELVVELVGCGVMRVSASVLVIAVVIIENRGFSNGHSDDGAAVLLSASGPPVAVTTLRPEQNGGYVVDLMRGLCTGALLGDPTTLAPSVAGVQDECEK